MIFEHDGLKNIFIMNNSDGQLRVTNAKRLLETHIPTSVRVPKTGAVPEFHRHSPGLRRGIIGIIGVKPGHTVSAGGVTVYRGSAGTLPAFTYLFDANNNSFVRPCCCCISSPPM
ncbi:hypothetical protein DPMN_170060 [Dreissena polymorpha]|uniref:Uncharacterized protein n=1 Tax=Dreissena polymorpha TaxID=45954 RepID=A0A9D4ICV1_DREPO|nr:hypothetical protein DPMN_170060 [Dreissena polymorpha]